MKQTGTVSRRRLAAAGALLAAVGTLALLPWQVSARVGQSVRGHLGRVPRTGTDIAPSTRDGLGVVQAAAALRTELADANPGLELRHARLIRHEPLRTCRRLERLATRPAVLTAIEVAMWKRPRRRRGE